jgi:hypothetical protein
MLACADVVLHSFSSTNAAAGRQYAICNFQCYKKALGIALQLAHTSTAAEALLATALVH